MAFNIKDEQTVEDLRELARLEGKSMSATAAAAIADSLARQRRNGIAEQLLALGDEVQAAADPKWLAMTQEEMDAEIYDPESGLPW